MLNDASLIKEAYKKGFGSAIAIKPAHMIDHTNCPVIVIPEDVELHVSSMGDLVFQQKGTIISSFSEEGEEYKWAAIIYYKKRGSWAEIMKYAYHTKAMEKDCFEGRYLKVVDDKCIQHYGVRNGDYLLYSHTDQLNHEHWGNIPGMKYYYGYKAHTNKYFELMPAGFYPPKDRKKGELSEFPSEGVCWTHTKELHDYLVEKYDTHCVNSKSKGVAWSPSGFWAVAGASGKPEYKISQLEPFLERYKKKDVSAFEAQRPLTPDECYVPFSVRNGYRLPEKWCIHSNPLNYEMIDAFMHEHGKEWGSYTKQWTTEGSHTYFHYPPIGPCFPAHSEDKPQPGYTLITTQQFKNVLTENNNLIINEDDRSRSQQRGPNEPNSGVTIKVQRPDITVRGREPRRGVRIECHNIQIKVGSGHLPDSPGLSKG